MKERRFTLVAMKRVKQQAKESACVRAVVRLKPNFDGLVSQK